MDPEIGQEVITESLPVPELDVTATPEPVVDLPEEKPVEAPKTFTQEELDAAIGKRLARYQRKWELERQHIFVQAVDFTCPGFGSVADTIEKIMQSDIPYDQLIREFATVPGRGWVYISFTMLPPRKQVLIIDQDGARAYA